MSIPRLTRLNIVLGLGLILCLLVQTSSLPAKALSKPDLAKAYDCLRANTLTVVSAHRGRPDPEAPENALGSLKAAFAAGVPVLEIDVVTTRDGKLILLHDDTLDRTTTERGLVASKTWAELTAARLRDRNGEITREAIPTLAEVLDWGRSAGAYFQIDVKKSTRFEDVVAIVQENRMENRVVLITYSLVDAIAIQRLNPSLMISASIDSLEDLQALIQVRFDISRLLAWTGNRKADPDLWRQLRRKGIEPIFGTLGAPSKRLDDQFLADGNPSDYQDLRKQGVVMIASDRPALAQAALGAGYKQCFINF